MEVATSRKTKVQSWYLDVNFLASYWGSERVYHHTAPITMNYALHEALRLVLEEGLEARWARHQQAHETLKAGLARLGLSITSQEGHQLWQLNAVGVPDGADEAGVRGRLLNEFGIEVGPGLGPMKGKNLARRTHGPQCHRGQRRAIPQCTWPMSRLTAKRLAKRREN